MASSRSTTKRRAADWTRPADSAEGFRALLEELPLAWGKARHKRGESLYPTSRSKIRRACCALTKLMLMGRGFLSAFCKARSVIS